MQNSGELALFNPHLLSLLISLFMLEVRNANQRGWKDMHFLALFAVGVAAVVTVNCTGEPSGGDAAASRDRITIVGSSNVFPLSQRVSEAFISKSNVRAPLVQSTGNGGGFLLFCKGVGSGFADITGASRMMTANEYRACSTNGVDDITEAPIGFQAITVAYPRNAPVRWDLTRREIFLALAEKVPVGTEWLANPFRKWSEINPALPDSQIRVFGPPASTLARDALVELILEPGCRDLAYVAQGGYDARWVDLNCGRVRTDGVFIDAGQTPIQLAENLVSDQDALVILEFTAFNKIGDRVRAVNIDGVSPSIESIGVQKYVAARALYLYIKNAHREIVPDLDAFVAEFFSEAAIGTEGYLTEIGLVALPLPRQREAQTNALSGRKMAAPM